MFTIMTVTQQWHFNETVHVTCHSVQTRYGNSITLLWYRFSPSFSNSIYKKVKSDMSCHVLKGNIIMWLLRQNCVVHRGYFRITKNKPNQIKLEQFTHWAALQCVTLIRMQLKHFMTKRKRPQNTGCVDEESHWPTHRLGGKYWEKADSWPNKVD